MSRDVSLGLLFCIQIVWDDHWGTEGLAVGGVRSIPQSHIDNLNLEILNWELKGSSKSMFYFVFVGIIRMDGLTAYYECGCISFPSAFPVRLVSYYIDSTTRSSLPYTHPIPQLDYAFCRKYSFTIHSQLNISQIRARAIESTDWSFLAMVVRTIPSPPFFSLSFHPNQSDPYRPSIETNHLI